MRSKNSLIPILLVLTVMLMLVYATLPAQALRDRKALLAVIDSYVLGDQPDTNLGRDFYLLVNGYAYFIAVSFIMFNLGELPLNSVIEEATIRLYAAGGSGPKAPVSAHYCPSNTWTEYGITYNNMPTFDSEPLDTANITGSTWYEWNVTSPARSVFSGNDKRLSLTLRSSVYGGGSFYSRTSPAVDERPQLSVLYSYTPSSGVDPVLVGIIVVAVGVVISIELIYVRQIRKTKPNPSLKRFEENRRNGLWRMAHRFLFISGFIILIAALVNFATAASMSLVLGDISPGERQSILQVIGIIFVLSILGFIASGCGWDAAMEHMKGEKTSKLTIAKKAFLVLTGILTIIEGRIYWNSFGFGTVIATIGILATLFSVPDLFYFGKGQEVQQDTS